MPVRNPRLSSPLSLLFLLTAGLALEASPPPCPRVEVVPPPVLSAAEPTLVRIVVETPEGGGAFLSLEVQDGEGRRGRLGHRRLLLPPGIAVVEWEVDPAAFASFVVPSDLTLRALLRLDSGWSGVDDGEATLAFSSEAAAPGFSVRFSAHPLLVFTQKPSALPLMVFNPHPSARQGEIAVTFLNAQKRKAVQAGSLTLRLEPGWNEVSFSVPASVTERALTRGNVQAKAVLRVQGVLRGRDFAPLDYDLAAAVTAAPSVGEAPLHVHFSAVATGGTPPYGFTWDFGDGETASGPEADHEFALPGGYLATATLTDSLGGRIWASSSVDVKAPPLSVLCEAAPAQGPYPLSVAFTASATGGYGSYDYAWSFGDGATSLERAPTHTYATPGTYTATVTVLSGGLRETCTRTVTASLPTYTVHAAAGPGGAVSPSGDLSVPQGESLTFAVTPDPGFHVSDVLVDGVSVGPVSSYTFVDVRTDHRLEARFAPTTYTVTTSAGPGGSVSPLGTVVLPITETLEVRILPDPRFCILDVRVDGVSQGPVQAVLLAGPDPHAVEAFFERTHHLITATASPGGSLSPSGEVEVPVGGGQIFHWTAEPGFHLEALFVDGVSVGTPPYFTFEAVRADHTLQARFARNVHTLYTTFTPGGTVLPNGNVTVFEGEDQTFTITPSPGFLTKEVMVDGVSIGPSRSHTFFSVDRDHFFHVVFEAATPRSHPITTLAGPGGSISPSGLVLVEEGSDITFTVTPEPHYHTTDVLVDGLSVGPVPSYTFTNVQASHTLAAFFAADTDQPASPPVSPADLYAPAAGRAASPLPSFPRGLKRKGRFVALWTAPGSGEPHGDPFRDGRARPVGGSPVAGRPPLEA